ncbi:16S rRNA (guanine(966)-N(2))-methyltransferase RsmD [Clostridia bacterium]|nr:16S rRNA (guanine(966)-N(2))-methyltransferase RsmD [Clostridia bacterium]
MRIIAGKKRGLKLQAPKGMNTRPTTDRVKENLFNILQNEVSGKKVLDLFAGTGALGIEAMSRGAENAVFVERDRQTFVQLCENLHKVEDLCCLDAIQKDSFSFLNDCKKQFDLVFLDPPYKKGLAVRATEILIQRELLIAGGLIVLETNQGEELFSENELSRLGLGIRKSVRYGNTCITILEKI